VFAFLLLAGFVCFVLAAFGIPKVAWIAIGLACWIAVPMITAWRALLG
jgi:hypothetical protein